jgi:hypothetical protein
MVLARTTHKTRVTSSTGSATTTPRSLPIGVFNIYALLEAHLAGLQALAWPRGGELDNLSPTS